MHRNKLRPLPPRQARAAAAARERALLNDKLSNAVLAFGAAFFRGDSMRAAIVVGATQLVIEHDPHEATCMRCGNRLVCSGAPSSDVTCSNADSGLNSATCGFVVSAKSFRAVPAETVHQVIEGLAESIAPSKSDGGPQAPIEHNTATKDDV